MGVGVGVGGLRVRRGSCGGGPVPLRQCWLLFSLCRTAQVRKSV